jgi:hypothetical protein
LYAMAGLDLRITYSEIFYALISQKIVASATTFRGN